VLSIGGITHRLNGAALDREMSAGHGRMLDCSGPVGRDKGSDR
jgi:hypothetical protein